MILTKGRIPFGQVKHKHGRQRSPRRSGSAPPEDSIKRALEVAREPSGGRVALVIINRLDARRELGCEVACVKHDLVGALGQAPMYTHVHPCDSSDDKSGLNGINGRHMAHRLTLALVCHAMYHTGGHRSEPYEPRKVAGSHRSRIDLVCQSVVQFLRTSLYVPASANSYSPSICSRPLAPRYEPGAHWPATPMHPGMHWRVTPGGLHCTLYETASVALQPNLHAKYTCCVTC